MGRPPGCRPRAGCPEGPGPWPEDTAAHERSGPIGLPLAPEGARLLFLWVAFSAPCSLTSDAWGWVLTLCTPCQLERPRRMGAPERPQPHSVHPRPAGRLTAGPRDLDGQSVAAWPKTSSGNWNPLPYVCGKHLQECLRPPSSGQVSQLRSRRSRKAAVEGPSPASQQASLGVCGLTGRWRTRPRLHRPIPCGAAPASLKPGLGTSDHPRESYSPTPPHGRGARGAALRGGGTGLPFSSATSRPRNLTKVSDTARGFFTS